MERKRERERDKNKTYSSPVAGDPHCRTRVDAAVALTRWLTAAAAAGASHIHDGPIGRAFHTGHSPVLDTDATRLRTLYTTTVH